MNMNEMFNYDYISQQAQQEHHQKQIKQVLESAQKLKDFLDSTDNIEPPYQNMASAEFCAILLAYMNRYGKI